MTVEVVPVLRSLDELAEIANREHAAVANDLRSAIRHAIAAGAAINEAHERLPIHSEWEAWVGQNLGVSYQYAGWYERLYVYRDRLPAEAFEPYTASDGDTIQPSVARAYGYIRGLPPLRDNRHGGYHGAPESVKDEARRLRSGGASLSSIAALMGVSKQTVARWTDARYRRRHRETAARERRRRSAARAALEREQRTAAARKASGGVSEIYSLVRKALQIAERETSDAETRQVGRALRGLQADLHRVEDSLGAILRMAEQGAEE